MGVEILQQTFKRLELLYKEEHLAPGRFVKAGLKPGWNAVIGTEDQCGMAMSFTNSAEAFGEPRIDLDRVKSFIGKDLLEVTRVYLESSSWQERAVGVAALSALSQPLLKPESLRKRGYRVPEESEHFSALIQPDDITAVVGYGGGIAQLVGKCKELHVTDMRPRTAFQSILIGESIEYTPREVQVHPEKENKEVLERASVVIITGSSLVNGTFAELMDYAHGARLVIMYGASVGLIPDVLFENGVHGIHSYRVSDAAAYEKGVMREMNMESVIHSSQKSQSIWRNSG
jgi:uncharacterized protein (DUF4213/DUF364 family)